MSTVVTALVAGALFVCFTLIRPVRDCSGGCGSCIGADDCALKERRTDVGE